MIAKLYIPYYGYNESANDIENAFDRDGGYISALMDEYNKSKDIVYNAVKDGTLMAGSPKDYKFGQRSSEQDDKVSFIGCKCKLFNDEMGDESVDGIVTHFAKQESFMCVAYLDLDEIDEDYESELSLWINEHNNVNKYAEKMGDDWVLANEPTKDLKMSFINNANEEIKCLLRGCRIIDVIEKGQLVLFIKNLTIIDEI